MVKFLVLALLALTDITFARPNLEIDPQNVVTVPTNCPDGEEWVDGECREIWIKNLDFDAMNVIVAPTDCPTGQQWVDGACRDIWRRYANADNTKNVITAPNNCGNNQQWVNGECRDIWIKNNGKNVIVAPTNCPSGQQWINGACRDVWMMMIYENMKLSFNIEPLNVVTVPPNCPVGQHWVNGNCVDIWKKSDTVYSPQSVKISKRQVDDTKNSNDELPMINNRNIISVPNQCPIGYRPDALGYCRPVFD